MNEKPFSLPPLSERSPWSQRLLDELLPLAQIKRYPKGTRLNLGSGAEQTCYMVVNGWINVYRAADDLLILSVPGPTLMGIAIHEAYIITSTPCSIAAMPVEELHRHVQEKNLWEQLARHIMVLTHKLYVYSRKLSAPTAYEIICNQLVELINEPESLRKEIAVERYIRDKTHLSRSSVMKILSSLRAGEYIVIDNGRLVEIRHLPSKY
ncbi:winged helix-turn-helix transcriptional regulator [Siccibacter turicensis]|uniref:Crp/Fnr family transcriptional regulator n=1 Tax=Siccibacter turicensis TaxID=357233 RepID=A0A2P8VL86_9ENTR|nr:winged helix-turn-helix transcriptional regulator [Siccibacter turicensis]MDY0972468.1 helix-turn-helix domain-containing protein [Siccibacter turicensis]PSN08302.1 Crp/Fnr family transcriptional regulator [Siccibacter turicensis]